MKIAFIGLGIMGREMALHLVKHDVNLTVYNRTPKDFSELKKAGAILAKSVQEAVQDADAVFSMLSTPEAVSEVFMKEDGALTFMKNNAIWADCSTVNPSFSKEAFKKAKAHGIRFLDTPVSGSKPQARNAELIFFVGGDKSALDEVEPYIDMMSKKMIHVGDTGKGTSLKMLVNVMLAQSMLIFSEAVLFGEKMGIDKDFLLDLLPGLVVSAPFTKFKAEGIKKDQYDVQFPLEWMHKDLHLAALTAYEINQPMYIANVAKEIYSSAKQQDMSRLDFSAIYRYLEHSK